MSLVPWAENATLQNEHGKSDSFGISLLEHCEARVSAIVHSFDARDRMALIVFNGRPRSCFL